MRTKLAAVVLAAAALTACGGSDTVTPVPTATSAVPAPEVPRVHADDVSEALPGDGVLPAVVGPVADAGDGVRVDPAAGPVAEGTRSVQAAPAAVTVTRKPRPVRPTPPAPADVPALVTPAVPVVAAPVIDRGARPVADPPVITTPGSAGESVEGVESVVIAPAPVIDRGTRDVADPPVVESVVEDGALDVTLLEKER